MRSLLLLLLLGTLAVTALDLCSLRCRLTGQVPDRTSKRCSCVTVSHEVQKRQLAVTPKSMKFCQSTLETVRCKIGEYISVTKAVYGRDTANVPGCGSNTEALCLNALGGLAFEDQIATYAANCPTQTSRFCSVNSKFVTADPCSDVFKYLEFDYTCTSVEFKASTPRSVAANCNRACLTATDSTVPQTLDLGIQCVNPTTSAVLSDSVCTGAGLTKPPSVVNCPARGTCKTTPNPTVKPTSPPAPTNGPPTPPPSFQGSLQG